MKRIVCFILVICMAMQSVTTVFAYKKNLCAFTKERILCYSDAYGSARAGSVARYTGMKIKKESGGYYLVTYEKKGRTRTGWIPKSDVRDHCLSYDGKEIAVIAPGEYSFGGEKIKIIFLGDGQYKIQLKKTKEYFTGSSSTAILSFGLSKEEKGQRQIWKFKRVGHRLLIQNQKTKHYLIKMGSVIGEGTYEEAEKQSWQLIRTDKNVAPYYNFCQYDGRWGGKKYGSSTTMAEAACGVLVVVNALYALNGQFMEPMDGAEYACETGYRIPYSGTDEGYLTAVASGLGRFYGFSYTGTANTISEIKNCLKEGGVVVAHVPGHYVAIVDYNKKTKKYLVLDSHPLPKRKTSPFGTWVKEERLLMGGLNAYSNFMYQQKKTDDFYWNYEMQELSAMQGLRLDIDLDIQK